MMLRRRLAQAEGTCGSIVLQGPASRSASQLRSWEQRRQGGGSSMPRDHCRDLASKNGTDSDGLVAARYSQRLHRESWALGRVAISEAPGHHTMRGSKAKQLPSLFIAAE